MGTNYYAIINKCSCCDRFDTIHIGKKSIGWKFSFQGYDNIKSWEEWKDILSKENTSIINEYDEKINLSDFFKIVENSHDKRDHINECLKSHPKETEKWLDEKRYWHDSEG